MRNVRAYGVRLQVELSILMMASVCELKVAVMADWDADDFEPEAPAAVTVAKATDKWEGEDEDDDVKVILFYNLSV